MNAQGGRSSGRPRRFRLYFATCLLLAIQICLFYSTIRERAQRRPPLTVHPLPSHTEYHYHSRDGASASSQSLAAEPDHALLSAEESPHMQTHLLAALASRIRPNTRKHRWSTLPFFLALASPIFPGSGFFAPLRCNRAAAVLPAEQVCDHRMPIVTVALVVNPCWPNHYIFLEQSRALLVLRDQPGGNVLVNVLKSAK